MDISSAVVSTFVVEEFSTLKKEESIPYFFFKGEGGVHREGGRGLHMPSVVTVGKEVYDMTDNV